MPNVSSNASRRPLARFASTSLRKSLRFGSNRILYPIITQDGVLGMQKKLCFLHVPV
jgi:hypothetical protein